MSIVLSLILIGCTPTSTGSFTESELFTIGQMQRTSPLLDESNQWDGNEEAIAFGQKLFFSHSLSPNAIACSTCHTPNIGFADGLQQSFGADVTNRHSPTLFDVAHQTWFRWDGGCDSLWCQAIGPLEASNEMNGSRTFVVSALYGDASLKEDYERIFGPLPDIAGVDLSAKPTSESSPENNLWMALEESQQEDITATMVNVTKSIAAFEATIQSGPTPFDDFVDTFMDDTILEEDALAMLTPEEEIGLRLFVGEGRCHLCHNGPTLSNDSFHNIGLGTREWLADTDIGRYDGITMLQTSEFNSSGFWSDAPNGLRSQRVDRLVQSTEQLGQYKTPTLRNLFQTAPYMHGGHFDTLDEVLEHYSKLEESTLQGHSDETLKPLNWTSKEKEAVIAFLRLLDDSL